MMDFHLREEDNMRDLPEKMVTLHLLQMVDGAIQGNKHPFLLVAMDAETVTVINMCGAKQTLHFYDGVVDDRIQVESIAFESDDSDDYMELVNGIKMADMIKDIEELGTAVATKFEHIMDNCPESIETLWAHLKIHVFPPQDDEDQ
jgi:hypothetical protein